MNPERMGAIQSLRMRILALDKGHQAGCECDDCKEQKDLVRQAVQMCREERGIVSSAIEEKAKTTKATRAKKAPIDADALLDQFLPPSS